MASVNCGDADQKKTKQLDPSKALISLRELSDVAWDEFEQPRTGTDVANGILSYAEARFSSTLPGNDELLSHKVVVYRPGDAVEYMKLIRRKLEQESGNTTDYTSVGKPVIPTALGYAIIEGEHRLVRACLRIPPTPQGGGA